MRGKASAGARCSVSDVVATDRAPTLQKREECQVTDPIARNRRWVEWCQPMISRFAAPLPASIVTPSSSISQVPPTTTPHPDRCEAGVQHEGHARLQTLVTVAADLQGFEPQRRVGDADAVAETHHGGILETGIANRHERRFFDFRHRHAGSHRCESVLEGTPRHLVEITFSGGGFARRHGGDGNGVVALVHTRQFDVNEIARFDDAVPRRRMAAFASRSACQFDGDGPVVASLPAHGMFDLARQCDLADPRPERLAHGGKTGLGMAGGLAHEADLRRRLDPAQGADEGRDVCESRCRK